MDVSEETGTDKKVFPAPAQLEDHDWNMFKDRSNGVTVRYYDAELLDRNFRPILFNENEEGSMEYLEHLRNRYALAGYEIIGPNESGLVHLRDYRTSANGRLEVVIENGIVCVSASGVFEGLIGPDDDSEEPDFSGYGADGREYTD